MSLQQKIAAFRRKMPGRRLVAVHQRLPRDTFSVGTDVMAECRPDQGGVLRSSDAESDGAVYEFVFFTVELEEAGITLREGDVIQDGALWVSIDNIGSEAMDQRQRATCSPSIDPAESSAIDY